VRRPDGDTEGDVEQRLVTTGPFTAPLGGVTVGRLEFTRGAAKVNIRVDPALTDLYRAEFEGGTPDIEVDGGIGGDRPQAAVSDPSTWRGRTSEVWLAAAVPWEISLKGGMWKLAADLRGLELRSLEVGGGASDVEVWLPAPSGLVAVACLRGASHVRVHRPTGSALRAVISGGAQPARLRRETFGAVGGGTTWSRRLCVATGPLRSEVQRRCEQADDRHGMSGPGLKVGRAEPGRTPSRQTAPAPARRLVRPPSSRRRRTRCAVVEGLVLVDALEGAHRVARHGDN